MKEIKELEEELLEKNVRFIRPVFVDILGRMLDFTVPIEEFKELVKNGKGFDGSSVEGFARTEESDLRFIPDIDTLVVLPWEYRGIEKTWREAMVFGYITDSSGKEYEGDTRTLLKDIIEKYKDFGILKCGAEIEFFIFENDKTPKHTDEGGYFRSGLYGEIRKEAQLFLNEMGIKTEFDHHEVANSQHEIDLTYSDALRMADSIILTKYVVKKIAKKYGVYASFMPKPVTGINGNGMHIHLSLWKDNRNLFFDEENQGLSKIARSYIAGLIKYGKDIQAALNQWINSYKRLYPGYEAPTYLVWGTKNRSAYIRVPEYQKGRESATRIEIRSPDPACNPYLALSLIHAAGIQGIIEGLEPPEPVEVDVYHLSESERKKLNIEELSPSLEKALELFKKSELVKKTLSKHIYQKFIENKKIECDNFNKTVTDYEIKNYFGVL
ncbi:MAG: glutamine synthetase [Candidatus Aenigmarchaeota archaeon]|nr:glutamine synthetase [Candidatus Aenigmarchaeota archaeon]